MIGIRNVGAATGFYAINEGFGRGCANLEKDCAAGAAERARLGAMMVDHVGQEFRTIGLQLGYRYEDSPICIPDGTPAPTDEPGTYVPTARPGSRAPHVWLDDDRTVLDLFGRGYTLLRFSKTADVSEIEAAARKRGVPLEIAEIDHAEAADLYEKRLTLVRPDGHVAWRADAAPADPLALVDRVRGVA